MEGSHRLAILSGIVFTGAAVAVGLTGGATSPFLAAFALVVFLLGWMAGPWVGTAFAAGLILLLSAFLWPLVASLPLSTLRDDVVSIGLIGLAAPVASLRWIGPLRRRRKLLEDMKWTGRLSDLTKAVVCCDELETAVDLVILGLEHVIRAPARAVLLYHPRTGELRPESSFGLDPEFQERACLKLHEGETGRLVASGSSVFCADADRPDTGRLFPEDRTACSYVLAPLRALPALVGAIYLSWPYPRYLASQDLRRLEEYADSLSFALQRLRTVKELEQAALTDPLTGLYNRRLLERRLDEEIARAVRLESGVTFFMIDINEFKAVNDNHGHPVGDQVLRAMANGLKEQCRITDTAARYGGDEFAVICPSLPLAEAHRMAERVVQGIAVEIKKATGLDLGASVGVAAYPDTTADPEELVREADQQLYRAKSSPQGICIAPSLRPRGYIELDSA